VLCIAIIVIRRTLLSNLNAHRTVIIILPPTVTEWLFSFYFIVFSLFTLVYYEEYTGFIVFYFVLLT